MAQPARVRVERLREASSATTLELLFDLVFVFALTQITALMAEEPTWLGLLRGTLLMAVVWWCWIGHSWVSCGEGRRGPRPRHHPLRHGAHVPVGARHPGVVRRLRGGLHGPTVFAFGYLVLRSAHLTLFWIISRDDPVLRRQVGRFAPTMVGATAVLLLAANTSGTAQLLLWGAAIVADYGGTLVIGPRLAAELRAAVRRTARARRDRGPGRVGRGHLPISWPIVIERARGGHTFDTAALHGGHALVSAQGDRRVAMARTGFTYLHLPMMLARASRCTA